jgi:hypothetical protein
VTESEIQQSFQEKFVAIAPSIAVAKQQGAVEASNEIVTARISICASCEFFHYSENQHRCLKTGDYLPMRIKFATGVCPILNWTRMTPEEIDAMNNP